MRVLVEAANATVAMADGVIVPPTGRFDVVLRVPHGEARPGLINAHDHLHRNHYGRLGHPPYANAYEWGRDIHARDRVAIARGRALPRREALLRGAWKNLLSGVTTVMHHDRWEDAFDHDFPLRVARVRSVHSPGLEPSLTMAPSGGSLAIHLAEGVDEIAVGEVDWIERTGWLNDRLIAVHVVGVDADGIRRLREAGVAIGWCPTSNDFLFGRTAPAALLAPGTDVLLGTDSLLTGVGTLLDELRHARALGFVSDDRLAAAVGSVAARRLGLPAPSLHDGARGDVVVLDRPLLEATAGNVSVVIAAGEIRVLDPSLLPALGPSLAGRGAMRTDGGVTRWTFGGVTYRDGAVGEGAPSAQLWCDAPSWA
jgi:hypothetical protein